MKTEESYINNSTSNAFARRYFTHLYTLFTHRRFYTQTPLHTDALHTNTFTHRRFHTQTLVHTGSFTHRLFYTQMFLHTNDFTQTCLHTNPCTQRNFYTQDHTGAFTCMTLLHTDAVRYRCFEHRHVFTHRRFYNQVFWRQMLLHADALTTKRFRHKCFRTRKRTHTHRQTKTRTNRRTHTHLLRTDIANSVVECIFRAKTLPLYLTRMGR